MKFIAMLMSGFTIKQKLLGGFSIVLLLLVLVVGQAIINLSGTQSKVTEMSSDYQPTLIASMALKNTLIEASSALGFYLLTKQEVHKNAYSQHLKHLDKSLKELKSIPYVVRNKNITQLISSVEKEVAQFKSFEVRLVKLANNMNENFAVLNYAANNINPLSREVLQALSNMLNSELEEDASIKRRDLILDIAQLRYLYSSALTNIRVYLFVANDDAMSNVDLFMDQAKLQLKKLENYSDIFTFDEEEGYELLVDKFKQWDQHKAKVIGMLKDNKARMDAYILKTEVGPLMLSIDKKLNLLVDQQRHATEKTGLDLIQQAKSTTDILVIMLVLGLLLGVIISISMTKLIVGSLSKTLYAMQDIAEGEGDLTQRLDASGKDEIARLSKGFNNFSAKVQSLFKQISDSVGRLSHSADDMNSVTENTQHTISQQRIETDQIATAVGQMSSVAGEVARNAEQAAEAATNADTETKRGRTIVNIAIKEISSLANETQVTAQMIQRLGEDIQGVSEIIDMIRNVTDQTNLLALNAAIEAARAGEQGRGFAVVADEVRTLADRTKQSTSEIQEKIASLQQEAEAAVNQMQKNSDVAQTTAQQASNAGESLDAITQAVSNITQMTQQIASAAEQQSAVAIEVNKNIENVTNLANQAESAVENVSSCSSDLTQLSESLRMHVGQFKF